MNVYWYVAYGIWTLDNYISYLAAPLTCATAKISLIKTAYNLAMVMGAFPAIVLTVTLLFGCLYVPYALYINQKEARKRRREKEFVKKMLESLYRSKWSKTCSSEECCICLDFFMHDQTVVTLPCNHKHYFHELCITNWLQNTQQCPFCKTQVTVEAIK